MAGKKPLMLSLGDSLTNFEDSMKDLGATFRIEGMSLNAEEMRLFGEEVSMDVTYADLIIGRRIGRGACSAVHVAEHDKSGELFAVKMFNAFDKQQRSQMIKEIKILTEVDCDCVVPIKGAWHQEGNIGIILQYMDHGSLEFMCNEKIDVDEQALAAIVSQILLGLAYLHFDNRVHRDIKPANVLINSEGSVKLSDFGIATALQNTATIGSAVGSYRYMAPERLLAEKYDQSSDIWSVGIMVIQLWTKIYPFHYCCYPVDLHTELETIDFSIFLEELGFPAQLKAFLLRILVRVPSKRATAGELLEDEWFQVNQIGDIGVAQEIVKAWLAENVTGSPNYKSPLEVSPSGRVLHAPGDDKRIFDDSHGDSDHPLISPRLSRADSGMNSRENSIKTEISGGLLGLSGSIENPPDIADGHGDVEGERDADDPARQQERLRNLNSMLPASGKFDRFGKTAEDLEDDLLIGVSEGHGGKSGGGSGEKRPRDYTLSSTRSSTISSGVSASKTQSTANYTTGSHELTIGNTNFEVPPGGIAFDENDEAGDEEDIYYRDDEFEKAPAEERDDAGVNDVQQAKRSFDEDYWRHK